MFLSTGLSGNFIKCEFSVIENKLFSHPLMKDLQQSPYSLHDESQKHG